MTDACCRACLWSRGRRSIRAVKTPWSVSGISIASISRVAAARSLPSTIAPASINDRRSSSTKNGFPSARFKISSRIRAGKFSIFSSCRMSEPLSSRVNGDKRMTWRTPLPSFCCSTSNRRLSSSRAAHNTKRGTSLESGTNISKTSQDEGSHQCRSSQTKTNGSRWARWRTYPRNPSKIPDRSASLERNFTRSSVAASIGSSSNRARKG